MLTSSESEMKTRIVTIKAGSQNAQARVRQAVEASTLTDEMGNGVPMSTTSKYVSFEVPESFQFQK